LPPPVTPIKDPWINFKGDVYVTRDRNDILRVLQALTRTNDEPLAVTAANLLSGGNSHSSNTDPEDVEVDGLPELLLPPNALIFTGGGAVVVQCVSREQPTLCYALKVTRPSLLSKGTRRAADEQKAARTEFRQHAPLVHSNIARVFAVGTSAIQTTQNVTLVSRVLQIEWIDGAAPLRDYLAATPLSWPELIDTLVQCLAALEYLHDTHQLVHWDIKSENFLVGTDRVPRLTDIGNARPADGLDKRKAFSTYWNLPEELAPRRRRKEAESFRRVGIRVPRKEWDSPFLDIWMFARDINRLLAADDDVLKLDNVYHNPDADKFLKQRDAILRRLPDTDDSRYTLAFVRLTLRRILSQKVPWAPGYYASAASMARDLRKLQRTLGDAFRVPELEGTPQHVVRIPVAGNVAFTPRIAALMNSLMISRLTKHGQLAAVPLVYPGATHRRSEHSVGVFATTIAYVRALYADRTDPFWRASVEARDIEALLLAAFLHDVGHISFSHLLEEMMGFLGTHVHEAYALAVLGEAAPAEPSELTEDRAELRRILAEHWISTDDPTGATFRQLISSILNPPTAVWDGRTNPELVRERSELVKLHILHSIISSAIDADKLDYLERDAHHCNVQYSNGIDFQRFLQALTTVVVTHEDALDRAHTFLASIAVDEKGVAPLESILVARYQMFSTVYWQHTVRTLTSMLQFAVQEFVGSFDTDGDIRLRMLIDSFRSLSDREALGWLRENLRKTIGDIHLRDLLIGICNALMSEGPRTYKTVFELRYERKAGAARRVSEAMRKIWDGLQGASDPVQYVQRWRKFRENFAKSLASYLKLQEFRKGSLLIDIPPAGKDQIEGVYVVTEGANRPIQDVSPMADAVSDAFQHWVRKIRVFMTREAYNDCVSHGVADQIHAAVWHVLEDLSTQDEPQQMLFSDKVPAPASTRRRRRVPATRTSPVPSTN